MTAPTRLDHYRIDDLDSQADDGLRYEVLNGSLYVTPPAGYPHNRRAQHIGLALLEVAPPGVEVLMTGTPGPGSGTTGSSIPTSPPSTSWTPTRAPTGW